MPVIIDGTNGVQASAITTTNWTPTNITTGGNTTLGDAAGDTVTINAGTTTVKTGGAVRFEDNAGGEYVAIKAPAAVTTYTLTLPIDDGVSGQALITDGNGNLSWSTAASGDVYGPASSTNTAVALFDGTTGKLLKNSGVTIDGSSNVSGVAALTASGALTLSSGTANGVAYLNGSKVLTTGSALTFDGTNLGLGTSGMLNYSARLKVVGPTNQVCAELYGGGSNNTSMLAFANDAGSSGIAGVSNSLALYTNGISSEQMRLTSTGLGIGTTSWSTSKLYVLGNTTNYAITSEAPDGYGALALKQTGGNTMSLGMASNGLFIYDNNAGTTRLTLDSSGNLGLGVTPSAWVGGVSLQVNGAALSANNGSGAYGMNLVENAVYSTGWKYQNTGAATMYQFGTGAHKWYTAPSGTAGNAISFTQAMTLDASGNLGVGTSSPSAKLQVNVANSGTPQVAGNFTNGVNADFQIQIATSYSSIGPTTSTPLAFVNGGGERMRIDSSGNLLVNTTSMPGSENNVLGIVYKSGGNGAGIRHPDSTGGAAPKVFDFCNSSNSSVGYIAVSGAAVAYTSTSDYRLKKNIQPMIGALEKVAQLNPVTYNWKADGSDGQGFIAHELQAVVPDCVTGEKDAVDADGNPVYQGIDTSFLVATLTKAIQEQQEQINQLKAEVAALKGV